MDTPKRKSVQKASPYEKWEDTAKELIEAEMIRRDMTYKELSRLLEKLGLYESADQINRKVLRKRFSAAFFFACMRAVGVEAIKLKPGLNCPK